jgi:dihydroorotase
MPRTIESKPIKNLLIRGARLIDPSQSLDRHADVLIENGQIARVGNYLDAPPSFELIDGRDLVLSPGWCDMHVHFREPGREDEETIETGCAAAVAGGFTAACPMPNTSPALDKREMVESGGQAKNTPVEVYPVAAATKGREGKSFPKWRSWWKPGGGVFRRRLRHCHGGAGAARWNTPTCWACRLSNTPKIPRWTTAAR